jgi:pimeloyl-ACP methyl ester carboxylesterase
MQPVQSGFAAINGAQIYYEVAGAGHPLVMVHAGIADRRMWDQQFQFFAEQYKVVRYDQRGYGKTVMVAGPFSFRQDLYGLLKFLDIPSAYLMGCSIGGQAIIDFALEHPDMVDALIPVGAGLSGFEFKEEGEPPRIFASMDAAYEAGDKARTAELGLQIWVSGAGRTLDQVDPAIVELVREMFLIGLATPDDLGTHQPLDPPAANRLGEIKAPTLVVIGDRDTQVLLAIAERLVQNIAGAQKFVMPNTAHVPNMEQPAAFNARVLEFLKKH